VEEKEAAIEKVEKDKEAVTAGGGGSKGKPPIAIFDTRSPSNVDRPDYREIYFTPEKSCKAEIKIEEVGADQAFPLKVKKVKWRSGKVENGNIIIDMKENERVHLKVFFVEDFLGALRIVAHEV